jgi:hypothetical protein
VVGFERGVVHFRSDPATIQRGVVCCERNLVRFRRCVVDSRRGVVMPSSRPRLEPATPRQLPERPGSHRARRGLGLATGSLRRARCEPDRRPHRRELDRRRRGPTSPPPASTRSPSSSASRHDHRHNQGSRAFPCSLFESWRSRDECGATEVVWLKLPSAVPIRRC